MFVTGGISTQRSLVVKGSRNSRLHGDWLRVPTYITSLILIMRIDDDDDNHCYIIIILLLGVVRGIIEGLLRVIRGVQTVIKLIFLPNSICA